MRRAWILFVLVACEPRSIPLISQQGADAGDAATARPLPTQSPNAQVSWDEITADTRDGRSFGLTLVHATEPTYLTTDGAPDYHRHLDAMAPGLVRVGSQDVIGDADTVPGGWVRDPQGPAPTWDREKIARGPWRRMPWNPALMVTIPGWPPGFGATNAPLPAAAHGPFAAFAADLVRILNVERGLGVRNFEIFSEVDRPGLYEGRASDLAALVTTIANRMRAVDPTIQVGGTGFVHGYSTAIADFVASAGDAVDFVSYHGYGTGDPRAPLYSVLRSGERVGDPAARIIGFVPGRARPLGVFLTQWALNWGEDERMAGPAGAVFDALAYAAIARSSLTGATGWKEADGWYGKLDANHQARPSAHVAALLNRSFRGDVVATRAPTDDHTLFAVKAGGSRALLIVNRTPNQTSLSVIHWTGSAWGKAARLTTIAAAAPTVVPRPDLAGKDTFSLELPPLSVTAIEE